MPTSYPGAFDALTNPATTDPLTAPSHAGQHADANDAIEALQVRAGLSGTAFPGSPASGARFTRTDRNIDYYYDGTRWLSTQLYVASIPLFEGLGPFTTNGTKLRAAAALAPTYDAWLLDFRAWTFVSGTNDASNYWSVSLSDNAPGVRATFTTATDGAVDVLHVVSIGALLGTGIEQLYVSITKTGTAGSLYLAGHYTYRLVG